MLLLKNSTLIYFCGNKEDVFYFFFIAAEKLRLLLLQLWRARQGGLTMIKKGLSSEEKSMVVAMADDDPYNCGWNQDETARAVEILEKIARCQDHDYGVPGKVFEAHLRSKKNISTEMGIFDALGRIYLIQRPTLAENPNEPYPGQYHSPGVTHGKNEFTDPDTIQRLVNREFGGVQIVDLRKVDERDIRDEQRGMYRLLIFVGRVEAEPKNSRGRFFDLNEIPWDQLVKSHREIILPIFLKAVGKNP